MTIPSAWIVSFNRLKLEIQALGIYFYSYKKARMASLRGRWDLVADEHLAGGAVGALFDAEALG
jgi:hypothetical protein